MIKYIRYKRDGGVEIYNGQLQVEKFILSDITKAINHRLNAIREIDLTLNNHQHSEETCFLVRLAYDFDKFEQYFEKINENLILNFCNKEFVSIYSIRFKTKKHFSKTALFERSWNIELLNQIQAPLISIEEIREKRVPLNFFNLEIGRMLWGNNLYYKYNDIGFCLPIDELIHHIEEAGKIEKYVKSIDIKVDNNLRTVKIHVNTLRHAYGKRHLENNYYGYLNLSTFDFVVEKHEEELLNS